jgi:predicted nuclease of predicted toxin-antitoxin system
MALNDNSRVLWSRLHFLVRVLGLTGLAAALVGLTVALIFHLVRVPLYDWANIQDNWAILERAVQTGTVARKAEWGIVLLGFGLAAVLLALIVEVLVVVRHAAGRRSASGFVAVAQIALAAVLLVGINVWSYHHPLRLDWTRNEQFTFPVAIQERLNKLQGETTIVIYLTHQSFGQRAGTLDPETRAYVSAAEHKVVEKLKDLVEQFRQFGKQFNVVVLDVEDWKNFKRKLDETTKQRPELRAAIQATPENTIFFAAQGKVQRLGFNELFLLDREASVKDNNGQGNLVLLDQGLEPLIHKIESIGEKRPKVGIAVVHGLLTSEGRADLPYTMAGVKKALTARGFDVKDVVLKKWSRFAPPEPAVYVADDTKLDQVQDRLTLLDSRINRLQALLDNQNKVIAIWNKESPQTLTKMFAEDLGVDKITEADRKLFIKRLETGAESLREDIAFLAERRKETLAEQSKLNVDSLAEQRRMADMQAKLTRTLADCDMLIIPRMTLRNVVDPEENIPAWMQRLDDSQVEVLRDFLKQGKPILFCLGPTNDTGDRPPPGAGAGPDGVEQMLSRLGVKLPVQTVLFDAETEAFSGRGGSIFGGEGNVEVPPVEFDWKPDADWPRGTKAPQPHPIRKGMQLIARSLGKDAQGKSLLADLQLRHPQPVYYEAPPETAPLFDPVVMITGSASWNEDKPFPTEKTIPEPPKTGPKKGTIEEKRRGPFPVAAAFTAKLPAEWYTEKNATPASVRMVVIGHGSIFNGGELSPARETLLLDSCNWLLDREQELALKTDEWKYPRVAMSSHAEDLWRWAAWVGVPGVFAYLGLVVLLVRRLR